MFRRNFWFMVVMFFPYFGISQPVMPVNRGIYLKTAPLMILDWYNGPVADLSVEFDVNKKFSYHSEFGFQVPAFDFIYNWDKIKGVLIRQELKLYPDFLSGKKNDDKESSSRGFLGFELAAGHQTYIRFDKIKVSAGLSYTETYDVTRSFAGLAVNFGNQWRSANGLCIDAYFGAGVRLNNVLLSISDVLASYREFGDWTVPHNWIQKSGLNLIPKFNFGLRIGIRVRD